MAVKPVVLPIANIAIQNTTPDLVKRVQTIVDYLNQGGGGGGGGGNTDFANTANNAYYLNGKQESKLNVNSALVAISANVANNANNSTYFGSQLPAYYTNASNANTGTLPDARLSANVVRFGTAQTQNFVLAAPSTANGNITFRALANNDVTNLDHRWIEINRCGFSTPGNEQTTLAFNVADYTFTISNTSAAGWEYFYHGIEYAVDGSRSATLPGSPPANGVYFIYINGTTGANANLVVNTSAWGLDPSSTDIPVALVLWNNSLTPKFWLADERHTALIDRLMHEYLHTTFGTRYMSGGVPDDYLLNTSTNAALTFSLTEAVIKDEDITHVVPTFADPDGATNAYPVFYRSGANNWLWTVSEVPFRYTPGGHIQWDNNAVMTEGSGSPGVGVRYYNTYLVLTAQANTVGTNGAFMLIHGRGEFTSNTAAFAEDPSQFDFGGFPIVEAVITQQLTWRTSNYTTKGKVQLHRVKAVDIGLSSAVVGATVTDHNALLSLQGGTAGEYFHLTANEYSNGGFARVGGAPANAQTLLWSAANSYWYPANAATGGGGSNVGLTDDGNSGNTKTINWGDGNTSHYLTLTGNCAITFANGVSGQRYIFILASGAGGFLPTWDANCTWGPGGVPLNSQASGREDMFGCIYIGSSGKYVMSYSLGYV